MRISNLFIALSLVAVPFSAFSGTIPPTVSSDLVLTTGNSPYIVSSNTIVNSGATLTVPSGVEVRFNAGISLSIIGTLAANNAVFTSNDVSPVNGSWGNITFGDGTSGNSTLTNCTISWGTGMYVSSSYTLNFIGSTLTRFSSDPLNIDISGTANLNKALFSNCDQPIHLFGTANFNNNSIINNMGVTNPGIILYGGNLSLSNTNITNCFIPLKINSPSVFNTSGTTNLAGNTFPKIHVAFSTLNTGIFSLPKANVPYVFLSNFTVSSGATLTVADSNILKFSPNTGLNIEGTLIANASSGKAIFFTSYLDDNLGGDSNEDAAGTAPNRNDWTGIQFDNSSIDANCLLRRAQIRYATICVETDNANPRIDSCDFSLNTYGLSMLKASAPIVTFNTFGSSAVTPIGMSFEANPVYK